MNTMTNILNAMQYLKAEILWKHGSGWADARIQAHVAIQGNPDSYHYDPI